MTWFTDKLRNSILWKKISYLRLFQKLRFPERIKLWDKEYDFYLNLIGNKNQLIFDVGANTGEKTSIFKKLSKEVICFEPSPNSLQTLKKRFAFTKVIIIPVAISNKNAKCQLFIVEDRQTLNTISDKQLEKVIEPVASESKISVLDVNTETLDAMIHKFGKPQYIKIDVEGHEKEVIEGLSKPVNYLSFENSTPNFLAEAMESIDHLFTISNGASGFNILNEGKFIFPEFCPAETVKEHLRNHHYGAAEIYCQSC
ncbi:hypothetical protein BH11BAC5_BH11BAC5_30150 [soil metagenome]